MTELDKLRELLDEAGASYLNCSRDITIGYHTADPHSVTEAMDGSLQVTGLTAEQVMRALGHLSNCSSIERTTTTNETDGPERSSEYVTVWIDHEPTKLHWGVPVVRCRDCEYRRRSWNGNGPNFVGDWFCSYTGGHEVNPDGFCYRGKRKEDQ